MDQASPGGHSQCSTLPISTSSFVAVMTSGSSPVQIVALPMSAPGSPHHHPDVGQRLSPAHSVGSLQSNEQMDVERQPSPQSIEERITHTPQPTQQETHPMMIETTREQQVTEKIVIFSSDPSGSINKDSPSPITTMAGSPLSKPQEGVPDMRSIVLINENHQSVPVSKNNHLMPPSPGHTPQLTPQTAHQPMTTESDHNGTVRALVVYNERGEVQVQDPIIQFVPNQPRDESVLMKEESYPITCGNSKGELYWKKFICPGINAKCVKCHGMWMTPKEFVQEAGKSTLKDWKRAIRINGTMLRKMIESGEVDYYQHETNCSNQCRSNKGASLESSQGSFNHSFEITETSRDHSMSEGPSLERSNSEDNQSYLNTKRPMLTVQRLSESSKSQMSSLERSSSEDSGLAPSPQLDGVIMRESIATADKIQDLQAFWLGIIRSDLFDEVVQDIVTQVSAIQHRAKSSPIFTPEDAVTMTNLANALELVPSIAQKTASHKMNVERQAEQSNVIIQDLERKLAEQKRYDIDLKRKSQHLENVMKLTPNEKRKRRMMRLYRQKAVESRIPPNAQQPGPSGQSPVQRLTGDGMVGVVSSNPLLRYPMSSTELWAPQSTAVAHALQVAASNQMAGINVQGRMMGLPIPPHLLQAPPEAFQVHQQDVTKK